MTGHKMRKLIKSKKAEEESTGEEAMPMQTLILIILTLLVLAALFIFIMTRIKTFAVTKPI